MVKELIGKRVKFINKEDGVWSKYLNMSATIIASSSYSTLEQSYSDALIKFDDNFELTVQLDEIEFL